MGYLAAGVANWRAVHDGRSEAVSAPIMLGRITLSKHIDADDYDLQLVGKAEMSPAFISQFEADHEASIDVAAVDAAAYSIARFDPVRGMDALRHQLAEVPGVVVGHRLLVSTFSDLIDPADPAKLSGAHPVIEALIRHDEAETAAANAPSKASEALAKLVASKNAPAQAAEPAGEEDSAKDAAEKDASEKDEKSPTRRKLIRSLRREAKEAASKDTAEPAAEAAGTGRKVHTGTPTLARSSDERDPEEELYLLDADESQARMLDAISAGESVAINAAAGTGATQTALNAAALLAAHGKRVLVIAEQRACLG